MGAIKSKIFDDSTTLDHASLKPGEMTKMRQDDEDISLPSAQYVTNQPERIENTSIDQIHEKISAINLDSEKKENIKSRMQSASAASFQPPDFLQRSQYFRSFRSASRRFFGKKDHTDVSISKISRENEASTGNNIPNRNYFYRSFKNLNRNNLNCISNLNNDRENIKGEAQPPPEMKNSWFKNLKSRSNADFDGSKNSSNFKKSSSREPIVEESPKFAPNKNLTSRSFNTIPTLGLSLVEIDTDEPKVQVKPKTEPRPEMTSESSNSSSSSAGMFSRQSNGSVNNSKSFDQFRKTVQIPIKIFTDQQSVKQKQQANYINSVFLNELNALDGLAQKNDFLVDRLKSEVENLNRLLDVFNREDPKVINELIFKTDDLSNQALKLQGEVKEQLKIKNKNSQMNRFTSEVVIKLYEECIIRLDRQLEILIYQINELTSIKNFLDQVASDYNQQSQQSSSSSYGYSDSYYSSSSSDGYYPNYQNYHSPNNFYYNSRSSYPSHYYAHPSTAYIEQPNAYYFTYRTPQQANLFYDPVSGQYFYRKPHIHMHPHGHPHPHPTNQYFPNQNGPYQRNSQNFFHPNPEPTTETKPNGGAIITEVSDDEDDYLRNVSEKKKDYVDAISLKGDE